MAKILVAEDDRNTNKLICAVMRRMGHEPLPARATARRPSPS